MSLGAHISSLRSTARPGTCEHARKPSDMDKQPHASTPPAQGKRPIDLTADSQAKPLKRARPSADEPAPPQQREEEDDDMPIPRGVAAAEREIMRYVEEARAKGDTHEADAIEATIVTTAAQREAAFEPRPIPENKTGGEKRRRACKEIQAKKSFEEGDESGAAIFLFGNEYGDRMDEFYSILKYRAKPS